MRRYFSETQRRLIAIVAVGTLVGLACAAVNVGALGPARGLQIGAASTHVLIDSPARSIFDRPPLPQDQNTLIKRAEMLSRLMVSQVMIERIGRDLDVPAGQISGLARITSSAPLAFTEPDSERRASQIMRSKAPYRIEVQTRPWTPVIDVYTQAPSPRDAANLADAAVAATDAYFHDVAREHAMPEDKLAGMRQLERARAGLLNAGAPLTIGVLTFLVGFGCSVAAMAGLVALRRRRRGTPRDDSRRASGRSLPAEDPYEAPADSWPHTTRVLPWMFAAFLLVLWLMPFNVITLKASLPMDLNLDRLVLPFIIAVWLLAVMVGGRAAPRLRMTWIHAAFGTFVALAFVSVVLDARYLNQSLELDLSLKKLPLLVSYAAFFLVAASAVRRHEVRPFMTYTLALAVICALGMLWEYRFKVNLFYDWSDKLLPGIFSIGDDRAAAHDFLGRRLVSGPAQEPLEAVTMLCMALPIALVRFIGSDRWRGRVLYGLAVCALMAATFATYRKSAFIAPISIGLTIGYFRRSDLLKLAPLSLVAVVGIGVLSPGAIGSTVSQFTRSDRLTVPTVSDRASDYDAVRPDVWSHVALGRGWGSYNHESYRILDSEILQRIIETGVLGLVAYLLIMVSVVLSARSAIASRHPDRAPPALIGAAAAVGFLLTAGLYDVLSFPHGTYIFLYMAGLVAVIVAPERRRPVAGPSRRHGIDRRVRRGPRGGHPRRGSTARAG